MRPAVLGLVADDLTGAGDAAVGFAEAGWRAVLSLRPRPDLARDDAGRPVVLAVSTASRAVSDAEAADRTARAVDAVVAAGAERLYLKIDSTVRGSVAGQVTGALTAWSRRHPAARALICPAFPDHLRTVVAGEVLVAGAPLALSAAAQDPVTPRSVGDLTQVVPGAVRHGAVRHGVVRHGDGDLSGPPGSRLVVDARTDADLDRLAAHLDGAGPEVVVVGSGGLSAALGRAWSVPADRRPRPEVRGRVLLAVSSLHPVSAGQLVRLRAGTVAAHVDVLTTGPETVTPEVAAAGLAARVAAALATHRYEAVVVIGGDGAAAVLADLDADGVEIDGALVPGCPTGIVTGGRADGLRLVTKSGGFGTPAALDHIVRQLRTPRELMKEAP